MIKRFLLLLIFFIISEVVYSSETIYIDGNGSDEYYLTGRDLDVLEDPTSELTLQDVVHSGKFIQSSSDKIPFIKNTNSTYWIRFSIKEGGNDHKNWILEILDQHIENIEMYLPNKGGFKIIKTGFSLPFWEREFLCKNFVFQITPDSLPQTYYLKVKSGSNNGFYIKIRSFQYFSSYSLNEYYLLGMFYGILLIMAIYNFIVFFSIREKVYIYYVLYVVCAVIILLEEDATGFQYLWQNYPILNKIISKSSSLVLLITFALYSKTFLDFKNNLPKINKALNFIILIYIVFFILDMIVFNIKKVAPIYLFPYFLIYIASIICFRNGYKTARFFIMGYSFMLFSIILLFLRMSGITHWDDLFTLYSFNIGLVFEVVVLSYALADRFKILKKEKEQQLLENEKAQQTIIFQLKENELLKDKVNRELESKVRERTMQLEEQAIQIDKMNEILKVHNLSLESKLKVVSTSRVMQEGVSFEEFKEIYPNEESCLKFVANLKDQRKYVCRKCGGLSYSIRKNSYTRRCNKCGYEESATSGTVFHKLKFPIVKAFYILFLVSTRKNLTVDELAKLIELRRGTCWAFKSKIETIISEKPLPKNSNKGWDYWILNY